MLRFLLELPAPRSRSSADDLLRALRNALVHESRIAELLASAGTSMQVDDLVSLLGDALEATAPGSAHGRGRSRLPQAEVSELRAAGVDLGAFESAHSDPRVATATTYASLLATALTTRQVAELLGVEESRVRQRLLGRSLYGIKSGRVWRVPRFQFTASGVVPGLGDVLQHVPRDIHPVALWRWLTTPASDLVLDDESVAPLDWLVTGHDPERVSAIAAEL